MDKEEHVVNDDDPLGGTQGRVQFLVQERERGESTVKVGFFRALDRVRVEVLDHGGNPCERGFNRRDRVERGDELKTGIASPRRREQGRDDLDAALVQGRVRFGLRERVQRRQDLEEIRLDLFRHRLVRLAQQWSHERDEVCRLLSRVDVLGERAQERDLSLRDFTLRVEGRRRDRDETAELHEEHVDARLHDLATDHAVLAAVLGAELDEVRDNVEHAENDGRLDVAHRQDAVQAREEGWIKVDQVAQEIATDGPRDEQLEQGRGRLRVLGRERR